ncbi:unnamed protein product, partial [Meganyctiphanes norvegica]
DKPSGNSFLKNCDHNIRLFSSDTSRGDVVVPVCHSEDNVFCSTFLSMSFSSTYLEGKCICYPGFYGDPETKMCRLKSEYVKANNLSEYKVKPGFFCDSKDDCIEGLICKHNFCKCPDGCVYNATIESCDCGDYYDSDDYWEQSYVWPSIVGSALGLMISICWCGIIIETCDSPKKNNGSEDGDDGENNAEGQMLNPILSEVNQPVSVPVVEPFGAVQPVPAHPQV